MIDKKKPVRGWGSPPRYYQGVDLLDELPGYTARYGKKVLAVIDPFLFDAISERLNKAYSGTGAEVRNVPFEKEVTAERIRKMFEDNSDFGANAVVGIGGGKTLDTAKGVADIGNVECVIVPSAASTDAPVTAHSMMYLENGDPLAPHHYERSPDVILVDSRLIVTAPPRLLAAGIGDALATAFEARACVRSGNETLLDLKAGGGYVPTKLGIVAGEACLEILLSDGRKAMAAAERRVITEAFENVLEANILLSGLGVFNVGCAAAHGFAETFAALPEADKKTLHGEKVGFGVLCQLALENESLDYFYEIMDFCAGVGLPITLEDMFIENTKDNIKALADFGIKYEDLWEGEPFLVTSEDIAAAITVADGMGTEFRQKHCVPPAYARR